MQRVLTLVAAVAAFVAGAGSPAQAQYTANPVAPALPSTQITQESVMAGSGSGLLSDGPGFPLTIYRRGHYVLAGNLNVPGGLSGIVIAVSGVTLDLNGHSIATGTSCYRLDATGNVFCNGSPGQTGVSIKEGSSVVRNGRISGFKEGVRYKVGDQLENLLLEHNENGIVSDPSNGAPTLITAVRAQLNMWSGISAHNALVRGSSSGLNGYDGFRLSDCLLLDSMAMNNNGAGLRGLGGSVAVGRNMSMFNKQGDYDGTLSLGHNVRTGGSVN